VFSAGRRPVQACHKSLRERTEHWLVGGEELAGTGTLATPCQTSSIRIEYVQSLGIVTLADMIPSIQYPTGQNTV
jgi:hypothetical protein